MRYSLFIVCALVLACNKDDDSNTVPAATYTNVAYGSDPAQTMDVYLPANRSTNSTKVIVMLHGGAWSTGDKTDFTPYVDTIKKRMPGYAIFNLNYRLSVGGNNIFPAQENDIKTAIEFLYSKRADYGISDKFVLMGASAGAHLALLHGYKYSTPVKIKAIVDFYGPTDMVALYNNPASPLVPASFIASIVGATPTYNPTIYQQSSPINFVNNQSPPTIILHGGTDPIVSPSQSTALRDKLLMNGVAVEYIFYPTEGHVWLGANLTDSFNKIVFFINSYVN